jgi:putative nucleotidyltransferase with HDIG domain
MTAHDHDENSPWAPNWQQRESLLLAPWAMHAADSAGRVHDELPHAFRSPYQRDRDRIVHSAAFRRLAHKTQVFTGYHGDYHRSRLTHTLEVTSIARTLARSLALNEDLVETLALAHDIGHPPLGHAGEDTLSELLADEGGFNHNAQALRIVELLEIRYPHFPGLNLSREVLDAQATRKKDGTAPAPLLETQVVDAADSIAYDTHDADDAVELGLVTMDELLEIPLVADAANRARDSLRFAHGPGTAAGGPPRGGGIRGGGTGDAEPGRHRGAGDRIGGAGPGGVPRPRESAGRANRGPHAGRGRRQTCPGAVSLPTGLPQ